MSQEASCFRTWGHRWELNQLLPEPRYVVATTSPAHRDSPGHCDLEPHCNEDRTDGGALYRPRETLSLGGQHPAVLAPADKGVSGRRAQGKLALSCDHRRHRTPEKCSDGGGNASLPAVAPCTAAERRRDKGLGIRCSSGGNAASARVEVRSGDTSGPRAGRERPQALQLPSHVQAPSANTMDSVSLGCWKTSNSSALQWPRTQDSDTDWRGRPVPGEELRRVCSGRQPGKGEGGEPSERPGYRDRPRPSSTVP